MSDLPVLHASMDGKELLRSLMLQAKLSAADFALKLDMPNLEVDIQTYLNGQIRNPNWATFKPVAKFFNIRISALFDTAVAEQVARDRGFMQSVVPAVDIADIISMPLVQLAASPAKLVIPIYDVVVLLAAAIKPHSDEVRRTVGLLLMQLLKDNISSEETLLIAAQIETLI